MLIHTIDCENGWYGPECKQTCGHCYNDEVCDKVNGACASGCASGWIGNSCTESKRRFRQVRNE
jgi:hypothetical protein